MATDIEKEFYKDSLEKKKIGKNGSKHPKRTGCRLPTDNMTQAEIRKKESNLMVYNRNKPMTWKEFKSLSEEYQKDYLTFLRDEFHASGLDIGKMMGISRFVIEDTRRKLNLNDGHKIRMTDQYRKKWEKFLKQEFISTKDAHKEEPKKDVASVTKPVSVPAQSPAEIMSGRSICMGELMSSAEFNFKQGTTLNDIVYVLAPYFKNGFPTVKISIEYRN